MRVSAQLTRTWAYSTTPGKSQVLKYLADTVSASRVNMNALIAHVDQYGYHQSETRYRAVGGRLVELKVHSPRAIRVVAYRLPRGGHLLLLGFDKSDGPISAELRRRALAMAGEFERSGKQLD